MTDLIDIGRIANDGMGDHLREAFIKVNQNFEELDLRQPEQTIGSNLGANGEGVFAKKDGYDLQFKKIVAGSNITIAATDNAITINSVGGLQSLIFSSDGGSKVLNDDDQLNIVGGTNIVTTIAGNTLTITNTGVANVVEDSTPQLGGDLEALQHSINDVNVIRANTFQGDLYGLVHGIDIRNIDALINGFDFGEVTTNIDNAIEMIFFANDVDFGTLVSPADLPVDLGLI